jgi:hypothetical protein
VTLVKEMTFSKQNKKVKFALGHPKRCRVIEGHRKKTTFASGYFIMRPI